MDDNEVIEPETLAEQFIELGIDTSIEVGSQKIFIYKHLWQISGLEYKVKPSLPSLDD